MPAVSTGTSFGVTFAAMAHSVFTDGDTRRIGAVINISDTATAPEIREGLLNSMVGLRLGSYPRTEVDAVVMSRSRTLTVEVTLTSQSFIFTVRECGETVLRVADAVWDTDVERAELPSWAENEGPAAHCAFLLARLV